MPIYMDRHDLKSVTAIDVAEAHREDLKIQDNYKCKGLTYWFDKDRGTAFCLIEAPDEHCVKEMHDHAHGLIPNQIIEVDKNLVNAFLGRIEDPQPTNLFENSDLPIIEEPAFRTIMHTCMVDFELLKSTLGNEEVANVINTQSNIISNALKLFEGREVKQTGTGYIISFASVTNAVICALEIQKNVKLADENIQINIGLSAGIPVTEKNGFFGETVQLAKRLCDVAQKGKVVVSSQVLDLYNDEKLIDLRKEAAIQAFSPSGEHFLTLLMDNTETIWNEPDFDVGKFGKQIGLSRSQLYRKTSSITGLSPNDFIKEFRLKKAIKLLSKQKGNIAEIAFETGFSSPSYFSKCFQKRFGLLPSQIAGTIS